MGALLRSAGALTTGALFAAGCAGTSAPSSARWEGVEIPTPAVASNLASRAPTNLTVDATVQLALRNNHELAVLRQSAVAAKAERRATLDIADPDLRLSFGTASADVTRDLLANSAYTNTSPTAIAASNQTLTAKRVESSESLRVDLRIYPPNPWVQHARWSAADGLARAAEADLRAAEWRITAGIRRCFEHIRQNRRQTAALERLLAVQRELAQLLETQAEKGQATALDAMNATRRCLETAADRDRLADARALVVRELSGFVGQSLTESALVDSPAPAAPRSAPADLQREAARLRAELQSFYWQWRSARATYNESRANRIPWFSFIQGSYIWTEDVENQDVVWYQADGTPYSDPTPSAQLTYDTTATTEWRLEAAVSVPLFSAFGKTTAARRARMKEAELRLLEGEEQIREEVAAAAAEVEAAEAHLRRSREQTGGILANMRRLLADMEQRSGVAATEIAVLKEGILRSEFTLLQTEDRYHLAILRLEELVGGVLPAAAAPTSR
jgi:outer membrane protein TolC